MFRLFISIVLLGLLQAQTQDQTLVPGSYGPEVVQAVVNRVRESCLFQDDKLFLRRLAYVASQDGKDVKTYRPGYDGGIWQIDQDKFNMIKNTGTLFSGVNTQFAIDWSTVQWSDLRKPLYSGLAAALYLSTISEPLPQGVEKQGSFYGKYFYVDPHAANLFYKGSKSFDTVCARTNLDLAFLVDASSSQSPEDFESAKKFAHEVVDNFQIGTDDVRVAFVTFSTGFKSQFDFRQYSNKAALQKAIDGIVMDNGETDTNLALNYASEHLFTPAMGSRDGASKVIILLTDGQSSDPTQTISAALGVRSKGITIFAIGVGDGIDSLELRSVANKPYCTHVIELKGYSDLGALVGQIQQVSCLAPAVLNPGAFKYPCSSGGLYQIFTNESLVQVTIDVTDGMVDIYGSLNNPTPNQAGSDFVSNSVVSAASVVLINQELKPLYLNITPTGPPNGCTGNFTIKIGNVERVNPNVNVTCIEHDVTRACSVANIYEHLYHYQQPPYNFASPCTPGRPGYMIDPFDQTKFIMCGQTGIAYVYQCDPHYVYDQTIMDCIPGEPSTQVPKATPTATIPAVTFTSRVTDAIPGTGPCNAGTRGQFFPYPDNIAKYIDCSNWPHYGYVKDCDKGKYWDQKILTCTYGKYVIDPATNKFDKNVPNPCRNPTKQGDLFYYPHPDEHMFIQCDAFGDGFEKHCNGTEVWSQDKLTCMPSAQVIIG